MMPNEQQLHDVPAAAFQLGEGRFQFAAGESAQRDANGRKTRDVTLHARSTQPIDHRYWGRCVHDFAGMTPVAETVLVDWCHFLDEVVGKATDMAFEAGAGLMAAATLVSLRDDDQADRVIGWGESGIPFQASIDFRGDGLEVEWIDSGVETEVNGETFTGPLTVFRKWTLRAIAVCPHGADKQTETEFTDAAGNVAVRLFSESEQRVDAMRFPWSKKGTSANTANDANTDNAANDGGDDDAGELTFAEVSAELGRWVTQFGAENGAKWFGDAEVDWADALQLHAAALGEQLTAAESRNGELSEQLAAADRGEDTASGAGADEQDEDGPKRFSELVRLRK